MKDIREMMQNYNEQTEKTGTFAKDEFNAKSTCDTICDACICITIWADCCCSCVS